MSTTFVTIPHHQSANRSLESKSTLNHCLYLQFLAKSPLFGQTTTTVILTNPKSFRSTHFFLIFDCHKPKILLNYYFPHQFYSICSLAPALLKPLYLTIFTDFIILISCIQEKSMGIMPLRQQLTIRMMFLKLKSWLAW